nr:50S ribosomal protein L3 [Candidatus Fokinia cryptica]
MLYHERPGLIGTKLGMTQIFVNDVAIPATIIHVPENFLIGLRTYEKNGYKAAVLGIRYHDEKKNRRKLYAMIREFRLNSLDSFTEGQSYTATHFALGQNIDVIGNTIGKGFAGGMKRHGFSGGDASHGASISHRALGSTGGRQDPGKVFKGKKMAGHMGTNRVTTRNLRVLDVDSEMSIIVVKGCIPGSKGKTVLLRDSIMS